jgi:hypothetical protein
MPDVMFELGALAPRVAVVTIDDPERRNALTLASRTGRHYFRATRNRGATRRASPGLLTDSGRPQELHSRGPRATGSRLKASGDSNPTRGLKRFKTQAPWLLLDAHGRQRAGGGDERLLQAIEADVDRMRESAEAGMSLGPQTPFSTPVRDF